MECDISRMRFGADRSERSEKFRKDGKLQKEFHCIPKRITVEDAYHVAARKAWTTGGGRGGLRRGFSLFRGRRRARCAISVRRSGFALSLAWSLLLTASFTDRRWRWSESGHVVHC